MPHDPSSLTTLLHDLAQLIFAIITVSIAVLGAVTRATRPIADASRSRALADAQDGLERVVAASVRARADFVRQLKDAGRWDGAEAIAQRESVVDGVIELAAPFLKVLSAHGVDAAAQRRLVNTLVESSVEDHRLPSLDLREAGPSAGATASAPPAAPAPAGPSA